MTALALIPRDGDRDRGGDAGVDGALISPPACPLGCGDCDCLQPDGHAPNRLIAVCVECGAWYLSLDGGRSYTLLVPPLVFPTRTE